MAKLERKTYVVTVGTSKVGVKLPTYYDTLVNYTGVKVSANDQVQTGHVGDLLAAGQIARIRISYRSALGKYRTADIVTDLNSFKTALGTLPGKDFRGGKIIDAFIPRRRRLG